MSNPIIFTPVLSDILPALTAPFPIDAIEVKPAAVNEDNGTALALAYADWRVYADRLDDVAGAANWSIQLIPWGPTRIIARLTILGVSKDASGEGDPQDENCGTIAEAQAKKRACAEFGLGRYLYNLPRVWGNGKGTRHSFKFDDPGWVVRNIYAQAGLARPVMRAGTTAPHPEPERQEPPQRPQPPVVNATNGHTNGTTNGTHGVAPDAQRLAAARGALAQAEQRTTAAIDAAVAEPAQRTGAVERLATDKQRGLIVNLIARCAEHDVSPGSVNRVGQQAGGIIGLAGMRKPDQLPVGLNLKDASAVIDGLKAFVEGMGGGR